MTYHSEPFVHSDASERVRIYQGDSRHMELPDKSVHMVCTSPPYWGLRRYQGEQELVWGNQDCRHEWIESIKPKNTWGIPNSGGTATGKMVVKGKENYAVVPESMYGICRLCGAWKGGFGSEPTPELYVAHTLEFLAEVWRVLRDDGTVWWNLGDSMYSSPSNQQGKGNPDSGVGVRGCQEVGRIQREEHPVIKPLDMCLIPQQVAIAARAQGWYVRSWVIWEKSNPMPESVNGWYFTRHRVRVKPRTRGSNEGSMPLQSHHAGQVPHRDGSFDTPGDTIWQDCSGCPKCLPNDGLVLRRGAWRPTDSVDYILMVTKTDKYYGDKEAVLEPYSPTVRWGGDIYKGSVKENPNKEDAGLARTRSCFPGGGRNLRNVWRFPTQSAGFEHYAAFPQRLPEICIQASTSEYGVCAECGAPYARVLQRRIYPPEVFTKAHRPEDDLVRASPTSDGRGSGSKMQKWLNEHPIQTLGWRKTCKCQTDEMAPAVVLDPFCGTGTTLYVAKKLGRIGIGYDLSAKYCAMSKKRVSKVEPTRRMV